MNDLPDSVEVSLTVRVGTACGSNRGGNDFMFMHDLQDGFQILRAKVLTKVSTVRNVEWTETHDIYIKTGKSTKQSEYKKLAEAHARLKLQI